MLPKDPNPNDRSFPKKEKLCHEKEIRLLFSQGGSFLVYPVLCHYRLHATGTPGIKVLTAVPRKKLKKAVQRNYYKRLLREAYRLQKQPLWNAAETGLWTVHLGLTFVGKGNEGHTEVHRSVGRIISQLPEYMVKLTEKI